MKVHTPHGHLLCGEERLLLLLPLAAGSTGAGAAAVTAGSGCVRSTATSTRVAAAAGELTVGCDGGFTLAVPFAFAVFFFPFPCSLPPPSDGKSFDAFVFFPFTFSPAFGAFAYSLPFAFAFPRFARLAATLRPDPASFLSSAATSLLLLRMRLLRPRLPTAPPGLSLPPLRGRFRPGVANDAAACDVAALKLVLLLLLAAAGGATAGHGGGSHCPILSSEL